MTDRTNPESPGRRRPQAPLGGGASAEGTRRWTDRFASAPSRQDHSYRAARAASQEWCAILTRISHTHGPKRTLGNRNLLTRKTVPREARIPTDLTACRMGDTDFQLVAVKDQVSQVRHHARWRRRSGSPHRENWADLWPVLPVGAGTAARRAAGGSLPSAFPGRRHGPAALRTVSAIPMYGSRRTLGFPPRRNHLGTGGPSRRPPSAGCADQRSAQFSRWGLPCLRVAPPGGMGTMRQCSVRVAPSATRRALPRLRNAISAASLLRIRRAVTRWFKRPGKGYQTRINGVLETHVQAQREVERQRMKEPGWTPIAPAGVRPVSTLALDGADAGPLGRGRRAQATRRLGSVGLRCMTRSYTDAPEAALASSGLEPSSQSK